VGGSNMLWCGVLDLGAPALGAVVNPAHSRPGGY
jgi:hypothetical protein